MFPNEMEFYHFLSPRDSFIGQASGQSGCSSALRRLKNSGWEGGSPVIFPQAETASQLMGLNPRIPHLHLPFSTLETQQKPRSAKSTTSPHPAILCPKPEFQACGPS